MKNAVSFRRKIKSLSVAIMPVLLVAGLTQFIDFNPMKKASNLRAQSLTTSAIANSCDVEMSKVGKSSALLRLAKQGNTKAQFQLAKIYKASKGANCQVLAFQYFQKAAQAGEKKAFAELGNAYRKGRGIEPNFEFAVDYFYRAARASYVSAAFSLIDLVEKGNASVKPNPDLARRYLKEFFPLIQDGIARGNAIAARSLARLYFRSSVVSRDIDKAILLYEQASNGGDVIAKHDLALILLNKRHEQSQHKRALTLLYESSRLGYAASYTALGRLHLKSALGLKKAEAVAWFEKGAELGHGGAYQELAKLYLNGLLVRQDKAEAFALALEGKKLGHRGSKILFEKLRKDKG